MTEKRCDTCAFRGVDPDTYPCNMCVRADKWGPQPGGITPVEHPAQIPAMAAKSALDVQVAGGHYKAKAIQPVEYISANNLNFLEGCIVKRVTRWRDKMPLSGNRFEDLEKIKHEVDLLIEMEKRYGGEA